MTSARTLLRSHRLGLAILFTYAAILACAGLGGWSRVWSSLGVKSWVPPFADLRTITGATVTMDQGLDPIVDNVGDPWHRGANYPRLWFLAAHALGLGPAATVPLGLVSAMALAAGFFILQPIVTTRTDAVLLYGAGVMPATLFGLERGNIDLMIFPLVALALVQRRRPWRSSLLLAVAAVLKIFPAVGLAGLIPSGRRGTIAVAAIGGTLAVLALIFRHDLQLIAKTVPVVPFGSYGVASLALNVLAAVHGGIGHAPALAYAWTLALSALAIGAWAAWRADETLSETACDDVVRQAFLVSAAIYTGTYLMSSNFDYRLIFLIPAVPFINTLRRSQGIVMPAAGLVGLSSLAIAMWEEPLTRLLGFRGVLTAVACKIVVLSVMAFGSVAALRASPRGRI